MTQDYKIPIIDLQFTLLSTQAKIIISTGEDTLAELHKRMLFYTEAAEKAKAAGDGSKVRRMMRVIDQLAGSVVYQRSLSCVLKCFGLRPNKTPELYAELIKFLSCV